MNPGGNLTQLSWWDNVNGYKAVLSHNALASGEIWPDWTMDIELEGVKAPYGEQTKYLNTVKENWNVYQVCGNDISYEGEAGLTEDSLKIDTCKTGYDAITVDVSTVKELDIKDIKVTVALDEDYGVCESCPITLSWNSNYAPSYITVDGKVCAATSAAGTTCYSNKLAGGSNLVIIFKDTVMKTVVDNVDDKVVNYFLKTININGDWDTTKCVYKCESLGQATAVCGADVTRADSEIEN